MKKYSRQELINVGMRLGLIESAIGILELLQGDHEKHRVDQVLGEMIEVLEQLREKMKTLIEIDGSTN